jgi:DNA replication protein DnaC
MNNSSIYKQTIQNLGTLRLNQMELHLEEVAGDVGTKNLSFTEGLLKLTNYEVDFKEQSAAQSTIHAAAFPFVKTLSDFDFSFQPSVSEAQMQEFCTLGFMEKAENIVFLGSSGVGKTHLATSIGVAAAKHHNITYFIKCSDLLQQLKKAKLENRLEARTNINFGDWDSVFYDAVVADAILNRVLHHSHVVSITGKSYRLKDFEQEEPSP